MLGALVMVLGAILAFAGGYASNRWGRAGIVARRRSARSSVAAGSRRSCGAGSCASARRSGSGLWLRVESFRRFLHESETFHAEEAAKRGVLREYTAWAVALGEIDRWERAVAGSTAIPADAGLGYVHMAPMLVALHGVDGHRPVVERRRWRRRFGRRRWRRGWRRELVAPLASGPPNRATSVGLLRRR